MSQVTPPPPDPHVPKIAPDDPRLRLSKARGRTLKKGPALALVFSLLGAVLVALVVAMQPAKAPVEAKKPEHETPANTQPPVVPDNIRNQPDNAGRAPSSTGPRFNLGVVPLPDGGLPDGGLRRHAFGNQPPSNDPFSPERLREERLQQESKARGAGILFESGQHVSTAAPADSSASSRPPWLDALNRPQAPPQNPLGEEDPNLQGRKNSFLDSEGASKTKDYLASPLRHPRSPYEVKAGSIIPAVLVTGINSDIPGPVIGQVRENVYDTVSGNTLLIPQGSRLLANYDSMVAWGQERILVCWNRLIFPNGDSMDLECMPAADLEGAAGLTDDVNEHWGRILKGAAVSSLLAATATGIAGNTQGFNPTVPQTFARNAAGEINQVGQQLTRRNITIQPTITVRPGFSVNVVVSKDMVLPPYSTGTKSSPPRPSFP